MLSSIPIAAIFFLTYETGKKFLSPRVKHDAFAHMGAASLAEVVRVLSGASLIALV